MHHRQLAHQVVQGLAGGLPVRIGDRPDQQRVGLAMLLRGHPPRVRHRCPSPSSLCPHPDHPLGHSAFQHARQRQGVAQLRPLTVKHIRLAAFAGAEHADKPWAERLRLWNTSFPEWHYPEQSNFRRDTIRAEARILYPGRYRGSTPLRERASR